MVFCSKCGTKNEDAAEYCVKCGAKLKASTEKSLEKRIEEGAEEFGKRAEAWGEDFGKRAEEWAEDFPKRTKQECFGLPHGGTIIGLIIGIIIILVGVTSLAGIDLKLWPLIIVTFGLLIFGGAIYSLTHKQ
ncbi:zinc-ribbon domain-containing protein [archaeon]|nr:zinc-ribbon domain-containing protein [archaeon]